MSHPQGPQVGCVNIAPELMTGPGFCLKRGFWRPEGKVEEEDLELITWEGVYPTWLLGCSGSGQVGDPEPQCRAVLAADGGWGGGQHAVEAGAWAFQE